MHPIRHPSTWPCKRRTPQRENPLTPADEGSGTQDLVRSPPSLGHSHGCQHGANGRLSTGPGKSAPGATGGWHQDPALLDACNGAGTSIRPHRRSGRDLCAGTGRQVPCPSAVHLCADPRPRRLVRDPGGPERRSDVLASGRGQAAHGRADLPVHACPGRIGAATNAPPENAADPGGSADLTDGGATRNPQTHLLGSLRDHGPAIPWFTSELAGDRRRDPASDDWTVRRLADQYAGGGKPRLGRLRQLLPIPDASGRSDRSRPTDCCVDQVQIRTVAGRARALQRWPPGSAPRYGFQLGVRPGSRG